MVNEKQREKLIELIVNAKRADPEIGSFTEFLADFLLAYGVFVPVDDCGPNRLRELVEANKAGRCVVLPCKPGDTLFVVIRVDELGLCKIVEQKTHDIDDVVYYMRFIGKTVFLTREAAEAALRGDNNG